MDDKIRDYANSDAVIYAGDEVLYPDEVIKNISKDFDYVDTYRRISEDIETAKFASERFLAQDMIDFEECINYMGIETRTENTDHFRNFWDIISDIGQFLYQNQSFLDDIQGKKFKTVDEQIEFLRGYCFDGITVTHAVKKMLESY